MTGHHTRIGGVWVYSISPRVRGDAHWAMSRPQRWQWLKAHRKTANSKLPPLMKRTNEHTYVPLGITETGSVFLSPSVGRPNATTRTDPRLVPIHRHGHTTPSASAKSSSFSEDQIQGHSKFTVCKFEKIPYLVQKFRL